MSAFNTFPSLRFTRSNPQRTDDATSSPPTFLTLVHRYQHAVFQIAHGILRDEVAAEKITRQVFTRVRRRLHQGADPASAVFWIYHASLRFACRHYWKSATPAMRRRLGETCRRRAEEFNLADFVRVLAFQPGRIGQHDCELIALRHVVGLPLVQIAQLLRMHPYEISNRLSWSLERMRETPPPSPSLSIHDELALSASA